MSTIKASCTDQVLRLTNTPVIASGGVNEDHVDFTFCDLWTGFVKTAVFYNNRGVYYSLLDEQDTCVIPYEVLSSKGNLYISVFGYLDGVTRTSEILTYTITEGAITTVDGPSESVYQQLMEQYASILAELAEAGQRAAVMYVEQSLTDSQKAQARANIGAGTGNGDGTVTSVDNVEPVDGAVSLNAVQYVDQSLTDSQKAQARTNIGAGTGSGNGTVKSVDGLSPNSSGEVTLNALHYTEQSLTAEQQAQVKANLGLNEGTAIYYGSAEAADYCSANGITPKAGTIYFQIT